MAEQLEFATNGQSLFIPGHTLRALRDSRYRNAAYALSELIDNSIDAEARHIDILCIEREEVVNVRRHWKLHEIAVLDDGHGMSRQGLIQALRFGGHESSGYHKIGKYGMGLPTASVSQCRRVDVWTWEHDINDLQHCYIDVDEVEQNDTSYLPDPDTQPIPDRWLNGAYEDTLNRSRGTLVIWSKLDRINEKPETIFKYIELEIGRIHRQFIADNDVIIRAVSFRQESAHLLLNKEWKVRPNDPLYLMAETSTPAPWDKIPMFEEYGSKKVYPVTIDGRAETIEVTYSIVKLEALKTPGFTNAGNSPHGKHASPNLGVSVVREQREILLENTFVRAGGASTIPQNRWWGCEVRFNRGADDVFGVDHNKQMAAKFTDAAKNFMNSDDNGRSLLAEFADEEHTGDSIIYTIVSDIRNTTRNMLVEIERRMKQRNIIHVIDDVEQVPRQAEEIAKQATMEAIEQGLDSETATDKERETVPPAQREAQLEQAYIAEGWTEDDAHKLAKYLVENDSWYHLEADQLDAYQMFRVRNQGGVLRIILNMNHPIYAFLHDFEDQAKRDLSDPARRAGLGIILMLMSWGRMEDQIEAARERQVVQNVAIQWGGHMHEFISQLNPD